MCREGDRASKEMKVSFDTGNPATIVSRLKNNEQCGKSDETRRCRGDTYMFLQLLFSLFTRCQHSCFPSPTFEQLFPSELRPAWILLFVLLSCNTHSEPIKTPSRLQQSTFHNSFKRFHRHGKSKHEQINITQVTPHWKTTSHASECSPAVDWWNHWSVWQQVATNVGRDEGCRQYHSSIHTCR
jgi:hypothetical protein